MASILGIALDAVPDFRANGTDPVEFWGAFDAFFEQQGFIARMQPGSYQPDCLYLASGPSARGCSHMVVMRAGELVHDPHPSGAGLLKVEIVRVLMPIDPAHLLWRRIA